MAKLAQPSLVHDKWDIFLTNLFQKLYPPLVALYLLGEECRVWQTMKIIRARNMRYMILNTDNF